MNEKEDAMTLRDALTGLYPRGAFDERFQLEMDRSKKLEQPLSIMFMDLDHFKSVNDGFGHQRGDEVLKTFSQRLKDSVRYTDLLFRYGGDEFVIVLPETGKAVAVEVAERILKAIAGTSFAGNPPLSLSTSIGIASFPEDAQTTKDILLVADDRQYNAKRAGRGRAVSEDVLTPTMFSLDEPSRLLERDDQNETVKDFFENLTHQRHGILHVSGVPGSGRSRFLQVVCDSARLQGYAVLHVTGTTPTRNRFFGSISEALYRWKETPGCEKLASGLPQPSQGQDDFIRQLSLQLKELNYLGLVICVEEMAYIDHATRALFQTLLRAPSAELQMEDDLNIAIVFSSGDIDSSANPLFEAPLRDHIELNAISQAGLRIWIRHSLQWEASDDFLNWFYQETGGLPRRIQDGLTNLIHNRQLILSKDGWHVAERFDDYPLKSHLLSQNMVISDNLPTNLTDFIGRDEEINKLKQYLKQHHLITIIGPGGQGKTRLAIQTAAECIPDFPDGIFFINLSEARSEMMLISMIEDILHIESKDSSDPTRVLVNYLSNKSLLLVLDSYDQLLNETRLLNEILEKAPGVKLLVTSRERLDVSQSVIFDLKGLEYPIEENIENLEGYSSVVLFFQCAQRIDPDFSQSEENNRYIIKVCQLLGGNPLGIELAAAWIHTFTPKEIFLQINDNLSFLTSKGQDQSNSLLAILDSFWHYLFVTEQNTLEKLSIFNSGFNREAAGIIAGASPFFLDSLAHKSYLSRTDNNRYQIHELLRQYSFEKLDEHPDDYVKTYHTLCNFYADFLSQREELLKGNRQKTALDEIYHDIGNIRLAWNWAILNKKVDSLEKSLDALFMFYDMRSWFKEGEEYFKLLQTIWLADTDSKTMNILKGKAIARQGWFAFHLGKFQEAEQLFDESISILDELDEMKEILFSLNYRAAVAMHRADYAKAKTLLQRSLLINQDIQADYEGGIAHNILGRIHHLTGAYDEAENEYQQSLVFSRKLQNYWSIAYTLEYLGEIAYVQGWFDKAVEYLVNCLEIRRGVMDQRGIAMALNSLGKATQSLGDYARANKNFHEALLIFNTIDNQIGAIKSRINLAANASMLGDDNLASEYFKLALQSAMTIEAIPEQLHCLSGLCSIWMHQGETEQVIRILPVLVNHPSANQETIQILARINSELADSEQMKIHEAKLSSLSLNDLVTSILDK